MFEITLSPPAQQLREEVEKLYGVPIKETVVNLVGSLGDESVLPDGTPEIRIDDKTGRSEQNIVHELFHLKLRKQGFAEFSFRFPPGHQLDDNTIRWAHWNNSIVRNPLQHRKFYPLMREMSIEPDIGLKMGFEELVEKGDYDGVIPQNAFSVHTGHFLRALLESKDEGFLRSFEDWFNSQGWDTSIKLARELHELVEQKDPQEAEEEIQTFVELLNRIYEDTASFKIVRWWDDQRGSHNQRMVEISVQPPEPRR